MKWLFSSLVLAFAQPSEPPPPDSVTTAPVDAPDVQVVDEAGPKKKRWSPIRLAAGTYAETPNLRGFGFGFDASVRYHMRRFAIGGGGRASFPSTDSSDTRYASVYFGPRFYLYPGSMSPLLGGGFGWSWLSGRDGANATGPSAYVELGIEVMRKQQFRVSAAARADFPFYDMQRRYDMPLSIGLTFSF